MSETYTRHIRNWSENKKPTNRWLFGAYIGFFAGLIWGGLRIVEYYFRFTDVVPGFLVEFFFRHDFLTTPWGGVVGWGAFIIFSIVAAELYAAFLFKVKGPWIGLMYGLLWWGLLYLLVGPMTGMLPWLYEIGWNSIITDVCLYALWGLFIGYSISVEFTDERNRESDNVLGSLLK
ncbi:YqhR family membrane protein [Paenibacillus chartarius]|uniref:YqhR family membrane protein n=1 Tax=Paenibacillus chartarius TaxID=747481 RepID=A0ABV6DTV5_9BACL